MVAGVRESIVGFAPGKRLAEDAVARIYEEEEAESSYKKD